MLCLALVHGLIDLEGGIGLKPYPHGPQGSLLAPEGELVVPLVSRSLSQ